MRRSPARLALCLCVLALSACSTPSPATAPRSVAATAAASTTSPTEANRPKAVVLGLGDSVTTGAKCGCTDFVTAYAAQLPARLGGPGRADNEGLNGQTAAGLAAVLERGDLRADLRRADTVIVTIGANDLTPLIAQWSAGRCDAACGVAATPAVGRDVARVLDAVRSQTGPATKVLVTGYWNVFEDGSVGTQLHGDAFADWSDQVTRALNAAIADQSAAHRDTYVDIYTPFEGTGDKDPTALLAADGDHPDAAGEALITRALLAATS